MKDALKRQGRSRKCMCVDGLKMNLEEAAVCAPNVRVKDERLNIPVYLSNKIRGTWQPHKTCIILNFFSLADSASSTRVALGKSIPISRRRTLPVCPLLRALCQRDKTVEFPMIGEK